MSVPLASHLLDIRRAKRSGLARWLTQGSTFAGGLGQEAAIVRTHALNRHPEVLVGVSLRAPRDSFLDALAPR